MKLITILIASMLITGCSARSIQAVGEKTGEVVVQVYKAAVKFADSEEAKELATKVLEGISGDE